MGLFLLLCAGQIAKHPEVLDTSEICHFLLEARTLPFGVLLSLRVPLAVSFLSASCPEETELLFLRLRSPSYGQSDSRVIIVLQSLKGGNWGGGRIKEVGEVIHCIRQAEGVA